MKTESALGICLELIEIVALPGGFPADARVGRFFRNRRFLGSRDRRFLSEAIYAWLRHGARARGLWRQILSDQDLSRPGAESSSSGSFLPSDVEIRALEAEQGAALVDPNDPELSHARARRNLTLRSVYCIDLLALSCIRTLPWTFAEIAKSVTAIPIFEKDTSALRSARELASDSTFEASIQAAAEDVPADPAEAIALEASLPGWIGRSLVKRYGEKSARKLARSFLEPASLDLRVNLQAKGREKVRAHLARELEKDVAITPYSHMGLRLGSRANLTATTASRNSWMEIQDEGSQIAVLLSDVKLGHFVVDACAGNGGKSLAIIDLMIRKVSKIPKSVSEGTVHACDIAKSKLEELERRAHEGGVESRVKCHHIYPAGVLPNLPPADLVFIDAPCSGLGTLRRNPDSKRRYSEEDVRAFTDLQISILERFCPLVKPGGILTFVTCSFLQEEGEDVADAFEAQHPEFRPYESRWGEKNLPRSCIRGHRVRIDPVSTKTDAFFVVQWERTPE